MRDESVTLYLDDPKRNFSELLRRISSCMRRNRIDQNLLVYEKSVRMGRGFQVVMVMRSMTLLRKVSGRKQTLVRDRKSVV